MSPRRSPELVVSAIVVAAFASIWAVAAVVSDSPESGYQYAVSAAAVMVVALPWVFAARMLWRAWSSRSGVRSSTMDGPARLLAAAVAVQPEGRTVWGSAMMAELATLADRRARWRFAASCARAAALPPRAGRVPVLPVAALIVGVVIAVGLAVEDLLPAMRLFAITFTALVGALVLAGVARSTRVRRPTPGLGLVAAAVAGVAGCIALTAYALSANPTCTARSASCAPATATAPALPWATAAFLAIVLAGCLGVALAPPRALTPVRLARPVAVGAALMLGAGVLLEAHLSDEGVLASFFLAPLVVIFVASLAVTVATRSFRAGVQTSTWVCLLGVLAVFAVGLLEALRRFRVDGALILDAEPAAAFGDNLVSLTFMLFVLPLWWLPFGVFGAAFGREMVSSAAPGRSGRGSCAPAP